MPQHLGHERARGRRGGPDVGRDGAHPAHRLHIACWFYECSHAAHRGLAELYVSDARYTKTYDEIEPGLADYVHDAMVANAARNGA